MDETTQSQEMMLAMNEALTLGSLRQHELTEAANELNAQLSVEISERTRTAALLATHQKVLEMLARGALIEPMLDFLVRSMESQSQDKFLVAIHLLEEDGHHFGHVAAPSLPVSYARATQGMDARLQMGPCSAAVVAREPTVVHDFAAETRWPSFTAEIVSLGLRGCFTTPIVSPDQRILGTVAIYYRQPSDPSASDHEIVEIVTRTASIAIERRQADERLRRALEFDEAVMTNMGEGLYTVDTKGLVTFMNPAAAKIFGYSFEELRGRKMHDMTHHHHPDGRLFPAEECTDLQVLKHGKALVDHEDCFIRKDGMFFHVVYSSAPLRSATGITGVVVVFRDVTEPRQAKEALRCAHDEMEQRVIERTRDLVAVNSELERTMAHRQQLERELLEISEREKRRIGEDLHDMVCQELAATALVLKSRARTLAKENPTASRALEEAAQTVNRNVGVARELARGLQACDPTASGLKKALLALAARARKNSGIQCHFKAARGVRVSDDTVALHFYRIAQEAVTNAIKHSSAKNVLITLDRNPTQACISVQDDGKGFVLGKRRKGLGLHLMRYRANALRGKLKIEHRPTGGMDFTCVIPSKDERPLNQSPSPTRK